MNRKPFKLEPAGIAVASTLTARLLRALFDRKLCAIHIPKYCASALAGRAGRVMLQGARITNWRIPLANGSIRTDMNYILGMPRQIADSSASNARKYLRDSVPMMERVRAAFSPAPAPLDQLRLQLDEMWPDGAERMKFRDRRCRVGLIRVMRPETMFSGVAGRKGVVHVDAGIAAKLFSANLYLRLPPQGGEIRIWNLGLNARTADHPIYRLIAGAGAFDHRAQELIHDQLPAPQIIRPRQGDLVILDSSRPHAVAGFERGVRMSLQTFLTFTDGLPGIKIYS